MILNSLKYKIIYLWCVSRIKQLIFCETIFSDTAVSNNDWETAVLLSCLNNANHIWNEAKLGLTKY